MTDNTSNLDLTHIRERDAGTNDAWFNYMLGVDAAVLRDIVRDLVQDRRYLLSLLTPPETSEESDPCVSHLALKEWDRMFDAWVKHQAGLPSDVPLWPNPEWSQDVAMVAHALAQQVKTGCRTPSIDKPPQLITGAAPVCTKHGVTLAFDGDKCWACQEEAT